MRRLASMSVGPRTTLLRAVALMFVLLATVFAGSVSAAPFAAQGGPVSLGYELVMGAEGVISVSPGEGIAQVRYYLDPSARDLESSTIGGEPIAISTRSPFALTGAQELGTRAFSGRAHRLVAAIDLLNGQTVVKTAALNAMAAAPAAAVAGLAAAPSANCAPLNCSQVKVTPPYILDFNQGRGGLMDKNGVGTGFTWVDKPTAGGTGYIPANLEVDTVAGVLKITTTPGIAFLADNNQDNTLGIGIDAANQVSVLDTRLVNIPALSGNLEQAGLWYGADDDNYLKLVVISEPGGTRVQFIEERNGMLQQQVVTDILPLTGASVDLRLRADPATNTVASFYGVNGAPLQVFHTFSVPPALLNGAGATIDPALGTAVFGGVFASDRFLQGTAVFQFDYFSLTAGPRALRTFLPLIARQ